MGRQQRSHYPFGWTVNLILAIIQARVGSTRLPEKMLCEIEGIPIIAHTLRRVKAADLVNRTILAIPDTAENDVLAAIGASEGVEVYRGSEHDVLARIYWASQRYPDVEAIVRICGEDVFTDPKLIDLAITGFLTAWAEPDAKIGAPQYMELGGVYWAEGMQVSVFTGRALEEAHKNATKPSEREHVCDYMKANNYNWYLKDPQQRSTIATKLSVDDVYDYSLALKVFNRCYSANNLFGYDETLAALRELEVAA